MTDAITSYHSCGRHPPNLQARMIISGDAECLTAKDVHEADPSISCSEGSSMRRALWRTTILAVTAGLVWILAVSILIPRENLAALSAVFVAAAISSIAGFAFSAIAGGMLLHVVDNTVKVVMIMMVCSIAIQSLSVARLWRDINWRRFWLFLFGGIVGLPIGVWLLLHLDMRGLKEAIGALLIAYAIYGLLRRPVSIRSDNGMWDVLTGCLGGITGGLAGFPGAAVTVWCGMQGWNKRRQRAIYQPYILVMQILGILVIRVLQPAGGSAGKVAIDILPFVPIALLGAWMGLKIFDHLSERLFKLAVNVLLVVAGIGLLV